MKPCPLPAAAREALLGALGYPPPSADDEVLAGLGRLGYRVRPSREQAVREVELLRGALVALEANERQRPSEAADWREIRKGGPIGASAQRRLEERIEEATSDAVREIVLSTPTAAEAQERIDELRERTAAEFRRQGKPRRGRPRERALAAVVRQLVHLYERASGRVAARSVARPKAKAGQPRPPLSEAKRREYKQILRGHPSVPLRRWIEEQLRYEPPPRVAARECGRLREFLDAALAGLPPPKPSLDWAVRSSLLDRKAKPPQG